HLEVLALLLEVAEGGEEVEHPVEAAGGERQAAHVAGRARQAAGVGEQGQGEIDAQGAIAAPPQRRGVTPGAAGEVQDRARPRRAEPAVDEVDVRFGLLLVAVRVKTQVLLAEPLPVPGHPTILASPWRPGRRAAAVRGASGMIRAVAAAACRMAIADRD